MVLFKQHDSNKKCSKDPLEIRFKGRSVDPSLYIQKNEEGVFYVVLYLDNKLLIRAVGTIDAAIAALKENRLVLTDMEGTKDYLSCEVNYFVDKKC